MGAVEAQFWIGVHGVIVGEGARILLLRRAATMLYSPGHWDLPGGHLAVHESFHECLHREVAEETGFEIEVDRLLGLNQANGRPYVQMVFVCRPKPPFRDVRLQPQEHDGAQWVTVAQMYQLPQLIPYLSAILSRGMLDSILL
jgi:8-oxo-dGTP pyrophosphatase MutT (NUDIX family)